jgi:Fe-S-cluster containining protein
VHAVFVTPAEALRLAAYLRATRSPDELGALRARLERLAPEVAEMSVADRARSRVPCPFLDDGTGACTVHPARPLLCRGYNSCDVDACRRQLASGDVAEPPPARMEQAAAYKHVFAGLVLGAGPGRVAGPLELIHAVRDALASDDVEARWIAGEHVFDPAAARISRERQAEWSAFVAAETA